MQIYTFAPFSWDPFITLLSLLSQRQSLRVLSIYDYMSVGLLCLWGNVKEANEVVYSDPGYPLWGILPKVGLQAFCLWRTQDQ